MDTLTRQHSNLEHSPRQPESTHSSSIHQKYIKGDQNIPSTTRHPKEHTYTGTIRKIDPVKSTISPKKPAGSVFTSKPINAANNADVKADALPVPVPDSGYSSVQPDRTTLVIHPAFISVGSPTSSTVDLGRSTPQATFMSASDPSTDGNYSPFPSSPPRTQVPISADNHILVIILASLGGAFFLVVCFVILKIRSRPKRRLHTPSLPVLQDTFPGRRIAEDSPVFGGKERFSPTLGGDKEKWTWTQYHSKSPAKDWRRGENNLTESEANVAHLTGPMLSTQPQKRPSLLSRSLSRLSALSAYSTSKSELAGLLASTHGSSMLRADPFADRAKARASYRRSKDKNAIRITVRDWDAEGSDSEQLVYGGAEIMPVTVQPPLATHMTGRERIKAPYPVGSCPSLNSIVPCISPSPSIVSDPFEDTPFVATPFVKTEARRERDTKALTAALGLQSPPTSADGFTYFRHHSEADDGLNTMPGSPVDVSMRLGNLMMSDYLVTPLPSVKPLRTPRDPGNWPPRTSVVDDKPPRVPSPAPLPSLAQMAMAHENGLDYDTYRSPTYSLYGIYANTRSVYDDKMDQSSRV